MLKERGKRPLAMIVVIAMVLSMFPATAFAGTYEKQVVQSDDSLGESYGKEVRPENGTDAVVMEKSIRQTGTDTFDITLKVETNQEIIQTATSPDAAVVLVLDNSNSMYDDSRACSSCGKNERAQEHSMANKDRHKFTTDPYGMIAAKIAAKTFVDNFVKDSNGAKREVAVVEFDSNAKTLLNWTEATENGAADKIKNSIDAIGKSKQGGTNIEGGLRLADNLLAQKNTGNDKIENLFVVMLTDGVPTFYVESKNENNSTTDMTGKRGCGNDKNCETWHDYKDIPSIAESIQSKANKNAKLYTVNFGAKGTVDGKAINTWLASFADQNVNANNVAELNTAFKNIVETIIRQMQAWEIIDPMGDLIVFDKERNQNLGVNYGSDDKVLNFNESNNTLSWDLKQEMVRKVLDEKTGRTTYTLTYGVKLDTSSKAFDENKSYATNGKTTLSYVIGTTTDKDTVYSELKYADFDVPKVRGTIPTSAYSVEYYKLDKETGKYPSEPTEVWNSKDPAKLHSTVSMGAIDSGYETKYNGDYYHYAEGDNEKQITISPEDNVLKLYYKPDTATVTEKHYYKTDIIYRDGSKKTGEYELANTVPNKGLYVNDNFNATLIKKLNGVEYKFDASASSATGIKVSRGDTTLDLYYSGTIDERDTIEVIVNRIYKNGNWKINEANGRYEEVFTEESQIYEESKDVRAPSTYTTSTVDGVPDGYVYESNDIGVYEKTENQVKVELDANSRTKVINVTFVKHASKDTLKKADVIVKHEYKLTEKKIGADGQLVTTTIPKDDTKAFEDYYVGEDFLAEEQPLYDGISYKADSTNAEKLVKHELKGGTLEITLSYAATVEPAATDVTVNHIYRTYDKVYIEETDDEGNVIGQKLETVMKNDGTKVVTADAITIGDNSEKLYVGYKYKALKDGEFEQKGYLFNAKDSTSDVLFLKNNDNVINLYYDRTEDNREMGEVSVHHIYVTYLTTVEKGKVVTKMKPQGVLETDLYEGKAGDTVNVEKHLTIKGKTYELRETNNFLDDSYTLRQGSNRTIEIVYERDDTDLVAAALTVTQKYINKVMTVVKGVAGYYGEGDLVGTVIDFTVNGGFEIPKNLYVGQIFKIDLVSQYLGVDYTADKNNPAVDVTLDENTALEYKYINETELAKTSVTVNHHYSLKTINEVGEATQTTKEALGTPISRYVGEDQITDTNEEGYYAFKDVKVTGTDDYKTNDKKVTVTVSNAAVSVDYYYVATDDRSVPASWKINHHYRVLDWNQTTGDYVTNEVMTTSGSSFATKTLTGAPELMNSSYTLDKATATNGFTNGYTTALVKGENVIDFYYTQRTDTREDTVVKVTHNYYKNDTSGLIANETSLPGILAGTYEEVATGKGEDAWVNNSFKATLKPAYGSTGSAVLKYDFKDSNPENYTIASLLPGTAEDPNKIVINYVYNYDASENVTMKVNHVYKTTNTSTGSTTEQTESVTANFGNDQFGTWNGTLKSFTAKEISKTGFTRQTGADEMTVTYVAGANEMTVVYTMSTSNPRPPRPGGGGGGGGGGTTDPGTTIPDEDVPLADAPITDVPVILEDEEVPLADAPVLLEDEEVPLAGLPDTGGMGVLGFVGLGGLLVAMGTRLRRKDEE